jgi:micrococcal nuclease
MRRALPILLALIAICPAYGSSGYAARVIGVSDGDTITVLTADKTQHRIPLWGIDSPETGQDFGSRAKQLASNLAFGKTVKILPRDTDRFGRTVAEVILANGRSAGRWSARAWPGPTATTRHTTRSWPG